MTGSEFPSSDSPFMPDLAQKFGALQSLLLTAQGIDDFLTEVAKLATGVAQAAASCGITIHRHGQPLTVASSDALAEQVDEVQYGAGTGPCLDTLESGAIIDVPDLTADTRWPDYRQHALAQGIHSSLSIPLSTGHSTLGALNLYGLRPYTFDRAARQHGEMFATQAATALTLALRSAAQAENASQLEQALTSRTVIDQALGILMAQQRCTAEEAFALLRAHSQNNNHKLRDVAAEVITRVSGRPPSPGRSFGARRPTS